jgi:hypothetical protein
MSDNGFDYRQVPGRHSPQARGEIDCLEEIGFRQGLLGETNQQRSANEMGKNSYGQYLDSLLSR